MEVHGFEGKDRKWTSSEAESRLGTMVQVHGIHGDLWEGYLYALDPELGDVALLEVMRGSEGDSEPIRISTRVVSGHAISRMVVLEDAEACPVDLHEERKIIDGRDDLDPKEIESRKRKTRDLLLALGLPFMETDESDETDVVSKHTKFQVMDCLIIHPPYTHETCTSKNEFVLNKVRSMLREKLPVESRPNEEIT